MGYPYPNFSYVLFWDPILELEDQAVKAANPEPRSLNS